MSYSSIELRRLFSTQACGYKFHVLAVYLHPTFTRPFQLEKYLESCRTSAEEFFCVNSNCLQVVGCFLWRAPSWMFHGILNLTLHNNVLKKCGLLIHSLQFYQKPEFTLDLSGQFWFTRIFCHRFCKHLFFEILEKFLQSIAAIFFV